MSRTLEEITPDMSEGRTAWVVKTHQGVIIARFYEPGARKNARLFLAAWRKEVAKPKPV